MATGQLPFTGNTPYEVMAQRVQRLPRPAGELTPQLPGYLRKLLERCMAVDPATRYASVEDVLRDLDSGSFRTTLRFETGRRRWLKPVLLSAAALALASVAAIWFQRGVPAGSPEPKAAEPVLPVLGIVPFENRTGQAALDWYGEGVARLVADNLAQSRHLHVVSADRTVALRKDNADRAALHRAAAAGGIGYLLTGDIREGPGGLSVSARVSDTRDGRELSAGRADGLSRPTLVSAADRVALVARKGLGLPPAEGVDAYGADFVSKNPEAYESYIAGLQAVNEYRYPDAQRAFEQSLAKAPDYAMARYWLATVKAASGRTEEALADIQRVVAQASRLPDREARYVRAAEAYFSRRYDDGIKMYGDLIAKYPYEIEARRILAFVLLDTNRPKDAVAEAQALARIAPESHVVWSILGTAHLAMKDFNQAVLDFRRYVQLEPGSANGHHLLGDAYRSQGEFDLAAQEYEKALGADATFHYSTVALATVDAMRGRRVEAEKLLSGLAEDTKALPVQRIDAGFALAAVERAGGRFRQSFDVLSSLEKPIAEEKIREAQALSERSSREESSSSARDGWTRSAVRRQRSWKGHFRRKTRTAPSRKRQPTFGDARCSPRERPRRRSKSSRRRSRCRATSTESTGGPWRTPIWQPAGFPRHSQPRRSPRRHSILWRPVSTSSSTGCVRFSLSRRLAWRWGEGPKRRARPDSSSTPGSAPIPGCRISSALVPWPRARAPLRSRPESGANAGSARPGRRPPVTAEPVPGGSRPGRQ